MNDKVKLDKINTVNDYIAVMQHIDVPEGIEIPQEQLKALSNEGIVVGVGPGVDLFALAGVKLGDRVVIHPRKYLTLSPSKGGYKDEAVMIVRQLDIVAIIGETDKYEIA